MKVLSYIVIDLMFSKFYLIIFVNLVCKFLKISYNFFKQKSLLICTNFCSGGKKKFPTKNNFIELILMN